VRLRNGCITDVAQYQNIFRDKPRELLRVVTHEYTGSDVYASVEVILVKSADLISIVDSNYIQLRSSTRYTKQLPYFKAYLMYPGHVFPHSRVTTLGRNIHPFIPKIRSD
jgi:hypothetical protein